MHNWLEIRKQRIYKSIEENLYTYIFVTLGSSIIGAVAVLFSWLRNHLINILTKPIIRWGIVEILFALCYIIVVCSFIFLLGRRTKKSLYKPETQSEKQVVPQSIQLPQTTVVVSTKAEPKRSIQWEKFHTFDGITFKYHAGNGGVSSDYFCSYDHVPMIPNKRAHRKFWNFVYLKCPICKEHLDMDVDKLKEIRKIFELIAKSHAKGDLKELPTRSDS